MIELKDFIAAALSDVVEGIVAAQAAIGDKAVINPEGYVTLPEKSLAQIDDFKCHVTELAFDVATAAYEKSGAKAKVGVFGGWFGASAEADAGQKESVATRIRFSIPMVLPVAGYQALRRFKDCSRGQKQA